MENSTKMKFESFIFELKTKEMFHRTLKISGKVFLFHFNFQTNKQRNEQTNKQRNEQTNKQRRELKKWLCFSIVKLYCFYFLFWNCFSCLKFWTRMSLLSFLLNLYVRTPRPPPPFHFIIQFSFSFSSILRVVFLSFKDLWFHCQSQFLIRLF